MPFISPSDYKPKFWLRNGHINTLYPFLFRKRQFEYQYRQRIDTPDEDFFDVDWAKHDIKPKKLVILCHGLEGSTQSQYMIGTSHTLFSASMDVAALNFRSCSGEMNRQKVMYNSGWTRDLHYFIENFTHDYKEIHICGFSLGGNVTLKYISDGIYPIDKRLKAVAAISTPCDLKGCSLELLKKKNYIYAQQFLKTLIKKIELKHEATPELIDINPIQKIKNLWDFDDYYSGPLHGYRDAEDYYSQCNSLQFLHNIKIPALLINAKDDTFLAPTAYPYDIAKKSDYLYLMTPKYGGHVGFSIPQQKSYWNEQKVLKFFNNIKDKL